MRVKLSDNGVVENIVDIDEDGVIVARDVMSASRVDSVLTSNHNLREHMAPNRRAGGRLHASIPNVTYYNWKKEWGAKWRDVFGWETYLAAKLNDPDNALLLTSSHRQLKAGSAARFRTLK